MFNQEYLLHYNETLRSLLFTFMYQISSNFGRPLKKCKNDELEIYLNHTFKINQN